MLAWLYDEDRWASGSAGGKVTADPRFRRRSLCLSREDKASALGKEEALAKGEPYFLAAYDVTVSADGYLTESVRIDRCAAAKGTKWYAFVVNDAPSSWFNNATYLDTMDKEAVATFIRVTHERYKETAGDLFDTTVPAIFSDEPNVQESERHAIPYVRLIKSPAPDILMLGNGCMLISTGMLTLLDNEEDPVLWRGPVIAGAVKQFWTDVIWGDLDYLLIDCPPGTGDVPLTVFQTIPLDGAVIVTSPQDLVSLIVKKAYNMARMMNIPVLGIIENMSYVLCP